MGSYFRPGNAKAITTTRIRATPGGTGWIKAASNYVMSALAKKEAEAQGYMECIFLDAREHRYFEEGSSCNLFFLLKNGTLVTPSLEDTILPGITRISVIELARDLGVKVEERRISVEEVLGRRPRGVRHRHRGGREPHSSRSPTTAGRWCSTTAGSASWPRSCSRPSRASSTG